MADATAPTAAGVPALDLAGEPSPVPGVSRNVFVLGLVSFAADISSEMLYPVIPLFLTATLGAPVAVVGVIEGVAEGTAGTTRVASGWLSDRLPRRRPVVTAGYALAGVGKLLLALTFVWPQALIARFADRLGSGTRTAPRDAMIADSSAPGARGRAFGFHRSMDTAGAVIGPLIGLALVAGLGEDRLRLVFLIAVIPAIASVLLVSLARERARPRETSRAATTSLRLDLAGAPRAFWLFLIATFLFSFGNSSNVFLLLRAEDLGLGLTTVILAYVVYNTIYAACSFPAGILADRFGPRLLLLSGFVLFGLVYLGFAGAQGTGVLWALFAVYGLTVALTDGTGRAFVAELSPESRRGTFLGLYHTTVGFTAVVASITAGVLWDQIDPAAPFALGAATGLAAAALLIFVPAHRSAAVVTP